MAKTGKNLQRLIRAIEAARAAGQPIQIESPKRIRDKVTGRLREHDVVLTITHEHHTVVMALECRDRSRPIGVDAVEAFHNKCSDTGIHSGVMVSSTGFARTAIVKAAAYNIRCLSLAEAAGFDWCEATFMLVHRRNITNAHMNCGFPEGTNLGGSLYDANGTLFDKERIMPMAKAALDSYRDRPDVEGSHEARFREVNPPVYMSEGSDRVQASEAVLVVNYTVVEERVPLSFRSYSHADTNSQITQAAVATVDVGGGHHVDFVLSTQADGSIAMTCVPNSTKPE